jgi:uncharacterized protein YndB with AHSA1/START domain
MGSQILEFKQTVAASPAQVYRAFTRATPLREWLCDVALADAHPGGRIYLGWNAGYNASGEYTILDPGNRIAFTWRGTADPAASWVEVLLAVFGDRTEIALRHHDLGEGADWDAARNAIGRGWTTGLENLASVVDTGRDLRYVRRPLLGISIAQFDAEVAGRLGVPVDEGIRLSSVAPGMGAEAAGLEADDVIVELGGKPVTGWPAMVAALQGRRAGDVVPIVFFRGAERKRTEMELSARPLPSVPPEAGGLAVSLRDVYDGLLARVDACFAGVSDAEAAHKPRPDAWNALETIAHLIISERENHTWIGDMINDDVRWSDRWENPCNVPARVAATAAAYPGVAEMTGELKRNCTETLHMVAGLPASFVAHKGTHWWLGINLLQCSDHWQEHLEQARDAIGAARAT